MHTRHQSIAYLVLLFVFHPIAAYGTDNPAAQLAEDLQPLLSCVSGKQAAFALSAQAQVAINGQPQSIDARLIRYDDQAFDLELEHPDYQVTLRRRADVTAFALPHHQVVFVGRGAVDSADQLAPQDITKRLLSAGTLVTSYAGLIQNGDAATAALVLTGLAQATYNAEQKQWSVGKSASFAFDRQGRVLDLSLEQSRLHVEIAESVPSAVVADEWPQMKVVELERRELERQLARGVRRALEILAPSPLLTSPAKNDRKVPHGELRWVDGQRVALLSGTPEEIGRAHGQLLAAEAHRCIDSVLYTFGTVQTVANGRWFRHDLEAAYARLTPHIPDHHRRETRALAESLNLEPQLAQTVNVFPELFHCSGFAVFGQATKDGKLYHGRVLDYMTTIGLQDSATTFIVAAEGKIPFANVGYAGFIGSVSGMNAQAVSLGEMGGRGEGQWDGVPMATLMRRALEECATLDDVMELWKNSPRTCEYYYVFADGKTNRAVGVAATPQSIQFILPGQMHELLGEGIPDTVVLSAGSRLEKLRERVQSRHGQIDAETAQWLMSRPVAMQSNLHNVLFVPQDGVLYVANADHRRPAADCPYVRLDLRELLKSMNGTTPAAAGGD